jgi:hypothetical protein
MAAYIIGAVLGPALGPIETEIERRQHPIALVRLCLSGILYGVFTARYCASLTARRATGCRGEFAQAQHQRHGPTLRTMFKLNPPGFPAFLGLLGLITASSSEILLNPNRVRRLPRLSRL